MRDFIRQFMLYSRSERRAVVALAVLILIVVIAPKAYRFYALTPAIMLSDSITAREIAMNYRAGDTMDTASDTAESRRLFYFDPNTISSDQWQQLGLTGSQAAVIARYRARGGVFRKPDDLRRIFVLSDDMKSRLIPYVQIADTPRTAWGHETKKGFDKNYIVEINTADSAAFEELPGIGPVLSARIVKFRRSLGGFYGIDQVGETYGVADSVFRRIRPHLRVNAASIIKINVNTATYDTLRRHPYIHARIAKAIIGYRNHNGRIENLSQLKEMATVITDEVFAKIQPYLTAQ